MIGDNVVATDHCTFPYRQRLELTKGNFSRCPNGLPGVENRLLLLFSAGVMSGRISPERFVALTSSKPAQLFGLWPRKGCLAPGSDADVVIIAADKRTTIRHEELHDNADYSPYEQMVCQGAILHTLSRGKPVFSQGQFIGSAGWGQFLHRQPFQIS